MFKRDLHDLRIWKQAIALAEDVYQLSRLLPKDEIFGMTSQIRRAAVSVPSNIAEGSQRSTDKDFAHFIVIAKGSLAELQTQLLLACNIGYISQNTAGGIFSRIDSLHRQLFVFHSQLVARSP